LEHSAAQLRPADPFGGRGDKAEVGQHADACEPRRPRLWALGCPRYLRDPGACRRGHGLRASTHPASSSSAPTRWSN